VKYLETCPLPDQRPTRTPVFDFKQLESMQQVAYLGLIDRNADCMGTVGDNRLGFFFFGRRGREGIEPNGPFLDNSIKKKND